MIKAITVTNYVGESLRLELARPELSGFAVLSVTGLGPGKAEINTSESSLHDGGVYNSARLPSRNIGITLMYLWNNGLEETRHLSYKYFPLKKKVTLLIETDTRKAEIEGYVESNEPSIFSSLECTSISILCPDPYFYSSAEDGIRTTVFSSTESKFEFPLCNNSLTANLIEMASSESIVNQAVVYDGDTEVGFTITIHATGTATDITIANQNTNEAMRINTSRLESMTGLPITAGDDIVISTVARKKYIYLFRDGEKYNILNCLDKNADWFKLRKGDNIFAYEAKSGRDNLQVKIEHRVVYEGV